MVVFQKFINGGQEYLCILDTEHQRSEEGTNLPVYMPLLRGYGPTWPKLRNAFHTESWSHVQVDASKKEKYILDSPHHNPSTELTSLLTRGKTKAIEWSEDTYFPGEFHYTTGYWEWTEDILSRCDKILRQATIYEPVKASLFTYNRSLDIVKYFCEAWCPTTNTLLTSFGELSISTWDLYECSGLPILGLLYDEVVPCYDELTGKNSDGNHFLPQTCKYLFHAYHCIARTEEFVPIESWITLWSKKKLFYDQPPPRTHSNGNRRPQQKHNPLDNHGKHLKWSKAEEDVFSQLGIDPKLKEETFLAAYLACWLCSFVLPVTEKGFIRPGVFKMASLMANGQRVGLVVPVLASIYRGNDISERPEPAHADTFAPFHFIYAWMGQYFMRKHN